MNKIKNIIINKNSIQQQNIIAFIFANEEESSFETGPPNL
jgi:hypothetical protein